MDREVYFRGDPGGSYYVKPLPLFGTDTDPNWRTDALDGVESGSSGSFVFTVDRAQAYEVFEGLKATATRADQPVGAVPSVESELKAY